MLFALRMLLLSDRLVCTTDIYLRCACGCFLTGCFSHVRRSFDCSTVGWTLQRRRRHIQRCRHKGQFAPGLFRVVCMFNPLILFVCMWMQFALRMGCFLTGCFSQTTSDVLSTIPLLDGHCSAAAFASNAAASAQRSFLSLPRTFVAACWCVGFLCPHSNVLVHTHPFWFQRNGLLMHAHLGE